MSQPIPKKSLGQHWLDDENILNEIVETAEIKSGDYVLEVGPGLGTLTKILLACGANVTAVEFDDQLFNDLQKNKTKLFKEDATRLWLVNQDILEFDTTNLPIGYKVVANIPYYLTSNLVRAFSESINPPQSMTLLVQKEVAERICAKPGSTSLLTITSQYFYDCNLGPVVEAHNFTPPPKVDSQVVHMARRLIDKNINKKQLFRVVKAGFAGRRKTLLNSLSAGLAISKDQAKSYLKTADIDPGLRAQNLSLEQWIHLSETINT